MTHKNLCGSAPQSTVLNVRVPYLGGNKVASQKATDSCTYGPSALWQLTCALCVRIHPPLLFGCNEADTQAIQSPRAQKPAGKLHAHQKSCGWLKNHQTYWSGSPGAGGSCVWESRIESKKQTLVVGERENKNVGSFTTLWIFLWLALWLGKLRPRNKNRMNVLSTHTYILAPYFQDWTDRSADTDNTLLIHPHFNLIQPHKSGGPGDVMVTVGTDTRSSHYLFCTSASKMWPSWNQTIDWKICPRVF